MIYLSEDFFPERCHGCDENCEACTLEANSIRLYDLRHMATERKIKLQAIARMQREVEDIEERMRLFCVDLEELR